MERTSTIDNVSIFSNIFNKNTIFLHIFYRHGGIVIESQASGNKISVNEDID